MSLLQVCLFSYHNHTSNSHIAGLTEAQVKLKLAAEEDEEAANGEPALHRVTASSLIAELLEIEDLQ